MNALEIDVLIVMPTLFVVISGGALIAAHRRLSVRRGAEDRMRSDTHERKSDTVIRLMTHGHRQAS